MSIKSSSVVQKMIDRLELIKDTVDHNTSSNKVQEELNAVKAYCDLLLDTTENRPSADTPVKKGVSTETEFVQDRPTKRLNEEDDVNGDSIFDF